MKLTNSEISEQLLNFSAKRLDLEDKRNVMLVAKRKILKQLSEVEETLSYNNNEQDKIKHEVAALKQKKESLERKYNERDVEKLLYRASSVLKSIQDRVKNLTPDECRVMEDINKLFLS